jgi:hypothetical protein
MKTPATKRLVLNKEILRTLGNTDLARAAGAGTMFACPAEGSIYVETGGNPSLYGVCTTASTVVLQGTTSMDIPVLVPAADPSFVAPGSGKR